MSSALQPDAPPPPAAGLPGLDPQLAALVVHDLKNAMGQLEAGLAAQAADRPSPQAQASLDECRRLRRGLVQFLTLYAAGQGLKAQVEDESPDTLLEALARELAATHPHLQVEVRARGDRPAFWFLDPRLVRMALDAAAHNAGRFARRHVWLDAQRDGAELVIRIEDDGPGPESQGQPDPGAAHATGLGRALCAAIAQAHRHGGRQGACTLQARPGGGARFELRLP